MIGYIIIIVFVACITNEDITMYFRLFISGAADNMKIPTPPPGGRSSPTRRLRTSSAKIGTETPSGVVISTKDEGRKADMPQCPIVFVMGK